MALLLTAAQMRAVDGAVVEKLGLPSLVLMENAGRGVAEIVEMETLKGLASHSAPATHPASPSLRSASPNSPAMVRGQQSWPAPHATN